MSGAEDKEKGQKAPTVPPKKTPIGSLKAMAGGHLGTEQLKLQQFGWVKVIHKGVRAPGREIKGL